MGHAREGIGPCDSHHSHAYCPVPPIRRRPSATPVRRVPAAAAGLLGRAAGASPDVDCGLPPWPTASSSRRRSRPARHTARHGRARASPMPEPASSRATLQRQRSFVTRTYLSPILLRVKVRKMGERYVDVGKVRSRSASSRRRYASSSSPRPGAGRHSPPDRTRRRRTTAPAHHGNQAGPLSGRGRCAPQASAPRQDPHGTSEPSGTDPHSPTPSRSGTGLRRAITSAGKSARSRSATRRISRRSSQVTRRKIQPCA